MDTPASRRVVNRNVSGGGQASPSRLPGSWRIRWAALTPARQAAVIVAACAATPTRNADNGGN
ncbi:lipoprotein LpqV [Mycobacterium tuberculosis]